MTDLLPNQVRVLSKVIGSNDIIIAQTLGIERKDAALWLTLCETLVAKYASALQLKHYGLCLDCDGTGTDEVAIEQLFQATVGTGAVVNLSLAGKWISNGLGPVTLTAALARTKKSKALEVLAHGTYLYIALAGELIAEYDVVDSGKLPPVGISFFRPTKQLRELIFDHAGQEIAKETGVKYWADRQKRILLAVPEATEKIFQRSLLLWLRHYVLDKLRIVCETRGFGQDATDITVMTGNGDYVIEVKWMGKNQNGTSYDASRIAEGIEQIKIYLNNDQRLVGGALVLYDGRPRDGGGADPSDPNALHPLCQSPHIIWLESETPSQAATTLVKSQRSSANLKPNVARKGRRST